MLEHAKVLSAQGLYSKFLDETARESLLNEVMKPYYEKKRDPDSQDLLLRKGTSVMKMQQVLSSLSLQ